MFSLSVTAASVILIKIERGRKSHGCFWVPRGIQYFGEWWHCLNIMRGNKRRTTEEGNFNTQLNDIMT